MKCFGGILQLNFGAEYLHQPPLIDEPFRKLTNEACLEAILMKHNHVIVNCALKVAGTRLQNIGLQLPIFWSWGALSDVEEDLRLRHDWAGIVVNAQSPNPPYVNRVPGDTKQSHKWASMMCKPKFEENSEDFLNPLRRVLLYCVKVNSRYGYIITDEEACFFRRTKSEEPAVPLSTNRPQRQNPQSTHNRGASINTVTSGTSSMSIDTSGSPYTDGGNPDINEKFLEFMTVPWRASGPNSLTINLCLWFIHLLAASDNSVKESYPVLGTWQNLPDRNGRRKYQQAGSNIIVSQLPPGAVMADSRVASLTGPLPGPSAGPRAGPRAGPSAGPRSSK